MKAAESEQCLMIVLVTGFEPMQNESVNASLEAVRRLPDRLAGAEIIRLPIPVSASRSLKMIEEMIRTADPEIILSVGQGGRKPEIRVEQIGFNRDDFRIPDCEGCQPRGALIVPDGPASIRSSLPAEAMVRAIQAAGIPACLSESAGAFLCNHVLYAAALLCRREAAGRRSGFVHVPLPGSGMTTDEMAIGLSAALQAAIESVSCTQPRP